LPGNYPEENIQKIWMVKEQNLTAVHGTYRQGNRQYKIKGSQNTT
jgi:hypothetical protein